MLKNPFCVLHLAKTHLIYFFMLLKLKTNKINEKEKLSSLFFVFLCCHSTVSKQKETNVRILSSSCQQIISSFAAGLGHEDFRASESD